MDSCHRCVKQTENKLNLHKESKEPHELRNATQGCLNAGVRPVRMVPDPVKEYITFNEEERH